MAGSGPYNPNGGPPGQMPQGMMPTMPPQQQMPNQQQMMPPRQMKRGTSKAVPVVVSAGLAVGVFCGLLFGVGTERGAAATPSKGDNVRKGDKASGDVPAGLAPTVNELPDKKPAKGSGSAVAAVGSGSGSGAGSGSGSAEVAIAKPKLVVEITPDTVAANAKITVDGKEITGTSLEYEIDAATNKPKAASVVVAVKAVGYKDAEQKVSLDGDTTVKFELVKGKSSLPKDMAVAAGSGSATPDAAAKPAADTTAKVDTTPKPDAHPAAKVDTTPKTDTHAGSAKATTPVTPPHHTTTPKQGTGSAKKPGGLIDI